MKEIASLANYFDWPMAMLPLRLCTAANHPSQKLQASGFWRCRYSTLAAAMLRFGRAEIRKVAHMRRCQDALLIGLKTDPSNF